MNIFLYWLAISSIATMLGAVGAFTTWLLNVYNLRKAKKEIERIDREFDHKDKRVITPDDPNWERISREAHEAFRSVRRVRTTSVIVPVIVAAILMSGLFAVVNRRDRMQLGAQIAETEQRYASLSKRITLTNVRQRALQVEIESSIARIRKQAIAASAKARWAAGPGGILQAEQCRQEIERIGPLLDQLKRLSKEQRELLDTNHDD